MRWMYMKIHNHITDIVNQLTQGRHCPGHKYQRVDDYPTPKSFHTDRSAAPLREQVNSSAVQMANIGTPGVSTMK